MEPKNSLFKSAAIAGLVMAGAGILIFVIEYLLDIMPVGIFFPLLLMLISLTISIVIVSVYVLKYRKSNGGYLTFGNAFLFCLIAFVTATFISTLFTYLFNLVDPHYMPNIIAAQKEYMGQYLEGKMSEEQIAETLDKIDQQGANATSILQVMKQFGIAVILGAIVSLIVGAFVKKNPQETDFTTSGGVI